MSNLRELTVLPAICALIVGIGCRQESTSEKPANLPAQMRFPVARNGEPILLPIMSQGKKLSFLLDTGSQYTCFDSSLPLGQPKKQARFGNSNRQVVWSFYATPEAFLGDHDLQDSVESVLGLDLSAARENNGLQIDGILGMDFLSNYVLHVDADAGECLILETAPKQLGEPFGLVFQNGLPFLQASIANYGELSFLLDTGSFGLGSGSLEKQVWVELVDKRRMRASGKIDELTAFGFVRTDLAKGGSIVVKDFAVQEPVFFRLDQSILGLGFLSRFRFTFDFPNKVIYMDRGKSYDRRDGRDLSGMFLVRKNDKTAVKMVAKGGPADKAGVCNSDVLLRLDERDVRGLSMFQLRRLLSKEGAITVSLSRPDGKLYTSVLQLNE
jgi:hypothetical protein